MSDVKDEQFEITLSAAESAGVCDRCDDCDPFTKSIIVRIGWQVSTLCPACFAEFKELVRKSF